MNFGIDHDSESEHEEMAITLSSELKGAKKVEEVENAIESGEKEIKVILYE